jgi:hypothetical protein
MSTLAKEQLLRQRGQDLHDANGDRIGKIEEICVDTGSGEPGWALVNTGLFGTKSSFVPLRNASDNDGTVTVPYDKAQVKDAPRMDPDGELSHQEEDELYRHYGLDLASGAGAGGRGDDVSPRGTSGRENVEVGSGRGTAGKDKVLDLLRQKGEDDKARQAGRELPDQVDPERDSGLLNKLGLEPQELPSRFGGGLPGGLGG